MEDAQTGKRAGSVREQLLNGTYQPTAEEQTALFECRRLFQYRATAGAAIGFLLVRYLAHSRKWSSGRSIVASGAAFAVGGYLGMASACVGCAKVFINMGGDSPILREFAPTLERLGAPQGPQQREKVLPSPASGLKGLDPTPSVDVGMQHTSDATDFSPQAQGPEAGPSVAGKPQRFNKYGDPIE
eukprot:comp24040_c0_seq1/m.43070 comp24040_c0_seq1/g.43070  ORF comp24040_c0_seq1/g.43070 comp24040_c0_seq1/m.43070 type:complete len:186 (-) comp24040_c0_seq1:358-915(-)